MAQLTERQQEIQDRLREGKKPPQIADELGITTNAVYQQLRRMRNSGNRPATSGRSRGNAGRSSARSSQRRPAPAPAAQHVTPLQAIRARKGEIEAELRESQRSVEQAARAATQASESHDKLSKRHGEELGNLTTAEAALTGKSHGGRRVSKPRPKGRSTRSRGRSQARSRSNGRKAAARGRGAQASSQGGNGGSPQGQPAAATA